MHTLLFKNENGLQASRKFEQQDTEAVLLRAGAEDTRSQGMLSQDISAASIPNDDDPNNVPPTAPPAGTKSSRFSLESALHAKPFVPQSLQKVSWAFSDLLTAFLLADH